MKTTLCGHEIEIDACDLQVVKNFKWRFQNKNGRIVFNRNQRISGKQKTIYLHRQILNYNGSEVVKHENNNTFDFTRKNLKVYTYTQNRMKSLKIKNRSSKYKGVSFYKGYKYFSKKKKEFVIFSNKWKAQLRYNSKVIYLGLFKTEHEAALAYNAAVVKYHGEFARLNII